MSRRADHEGELARNPIDKVEPMKFMETGKLLRDNQLLIGFQTMVPQCTSDDFHMGIAIKIDWLTVGLGLMI